MKWLIFLNDKAYNSVFKQQLDLQSNLLGYLKDSNAAVHSVDTGIS